MKTIPVALQGHYNGSTQTVTRMLRITRKDGVVFTFTDHDTDLKYGNEVYGSALGYTSKNITSGSALQADNLNVLGFLESPSITEEDLRLGFWNYADFTLFEINWENVGNGIRHLRDGTFGEITSHRGYFETELRGLMQHYITPLLRVTARECDADLGNARCKIMLGAPGDSPTGDWVVAGVVDYSTSGRVIFDDNRTESDNWFTGGLLTFTSGLNNGYSVEIKVSDFNSGDPRIELFVPAPFEITPGDTYTAQAGCTKRFKEDCIGKFNNGINFRGFPHVPLSDTYQYGGEYGKVQP